MDNKFNELKRIEKLNIVEQLKSIHIDDFHYFIDEIIMKTQNPDYICGRQNYLLCLDINYLFDIINESIINYHGLKLQNCDKNKFIEFAKYILDKNFNIVNVVGNVNNRIANSCEEIQHYFVNKYININISELNYLVKLNLLLMRIYYDDLFIDLQNTFIIDINDISNYGNIFTDLIKNIKQITYGNYKCIKIFDRIMQLNIKINNSNDKISMIDYLNIINENSDNKLRFVILAFVNMFVNEMINYDHIDVTNSIIKHIIINYRIVILQLLDSNNLVNKFNKDDGYMPLENMIWYILETNNIGYIELLINITENSKLSKYDIICIVLNSLGVKYLCKVKFKILTVGFTQYLIHLHNTAINNYVKININELFLTKNDVILILFYHSLSIKNNTESVEYIYLKYIKNKIPINFRILIKLIDDDNIQHMLNIISEEDKALLYSKNILITGDGYSLEDGIYCNKFKLCIDIANNNTNNNTNNSKNQIIDTLMKDLIKYCSAGYTYTSKQSCFTTCNKILELFKLIEEYKQLSDKNNIQYILKLFVKCVYQVNWYMVEYIMKKYKHINFFNDVIINDLLGLYDHCNYHKNHCEFDCNSKLCNIMINEYKNSEFYNHNTLVKMKDLFINIGYHNVFDILDKNNIPYELNDIESTRFGNWTDIIECIKRRVDVDYYFNKHSTKFITRDDFNNNDYGKYIARISYNNRFFTDNDYFLPEKIFNFAVLNKPALLNIETIILINNIGNSPIISRFNTIAKIYQCNVDNLLQLLPIELFNLLIEQMHLEQCNSIMNIFKSIII